MSLLCALIPLSLVCGEPRYPDDLAVFDGKSPFEKVEDARMLDIPRVAFSIKLYAGDDGFDFIRGLDAGTTIEMRANALIAGLCGRGACEDANAAVAIGRDGGVVALCTYSKDDDHGAPAGKVHWAGPFLNKTIAAKGCPQEADAIIVAYAAMRE